VPVSEEKNGTCSAWQCPAWQVHSLLCGEASSRYSRRIT